MAESTDISDDLFEKCLRAFHGAGSGHPSLATLYDLTEDPGRLRDALRVAFAAGLATREAGLADADAALRRLGDQAQHLVNRLDDRNEQVRKLEATCRTAMRMIDETREHLAATATILHVISEVPDAQE